jgi:hypothetical protein
MSRIKMSFAFITVVIAILIVDHIVPWNQLFQSVEAKGLSVASSSSFVNHAEGKIHSDNKILSSILASKNSRSSNDHGNGGGRSSSHSSSDASTSNSGTSMGNLAGNSPDVVGGSSSSSLAAPYDSGTISSGQNSDSSTTGSITGNTGGDKPIGPSNTYNANNIPFILPFP